MRDAGGRGREAPPALPPDVVRNEVDPQSWDWEVHFSVEKKVFACPGQRGRSLFNCHMAEDPTDGDDRDGNPVPGEDKVGLHTFNLDYHSDPTGDPDDGFENFESACNAAGGHDAPPSPTRRSWPVGIMTATRPLRASRTRCKACSIW